MAALTSTASQAANRRPRAVRLAIGLWLALAVIVFQVMFDGETRMAAFRSAEAQLEAFERGQPVVTIEKGFRPQVRAAAARAGLVAAGIAALGCAAVAWGARAPSRDRV